MATVTCPKCGLRVRAEDGECFACGAQLPRILKEPEYEEPSYTSNADDAGYHRSMGTPSQPITNRPNSIGYNNSNNVQQSNVPNQGGTTSTPERRYPEHIILPPPPPIPPFPNDPSLVKSTGKVSSSKKKLTNSSLSVLAFIFSILIFPVGFVLGLIDVLKHDKEHKHGFSIAALVISCLAFIVAISQMGSSSKKNDFIAPPAVDEEIASIQAEAEAIVEETQEAASVVEETPIVEEPVTVEETGEELTVEEKTYSEETSTETSEETDDGQTDTADSTLPDDLIRDDVKEAIDSYEAYVDELCEFMKTYDQSNTKMLLQYTQAMSKLGDMKKECEEAKNTKWTKAESLYYLEVLARCNKKEMEALQ